MAKHRIFTTPFARVHPLYVAKAEQKVHLRQEVDQIVRWLTGYTRPQIETLLADVTDSETLFARAPVLNPARLTLLGVICDVGIGTRWTEGVKARFLQTWLELEPA